MRFRAPRFLRRMMAVFRWSAQDDEMNQEMAFHVEAMTREYVRSGMSEAEAAHAARKQFGNRLRLKEAGHDVRSGHLDELVQDIRSGLRQLTGAPTFALVAAITLALASASTLLCLPSSSRRCSTRCHMRTPVGWCVCMAAHERNSSVDR